MEKHILALEVADESTAEVGEKSLEETALDLAIEEIYEANGQKWKMWASSAKSLRIGHIILIADSDTIAPELSLLEIRRRLVITRIASGTQLASWLNALK